MKQMKHSDIFMVIIFITASLLLTACGGRAQAKETYTIGVVNYVPMLDPVFDGLKAGMADLGYVEGENVTYIYSGALEANPEIIDAEIQSMLEQGIDLIITNGTLPTLRAKQILAGKDIPIIFAPVINPAEEGIVEDLRHPGGTITGIRNENSIPKALEWLLQTAPGTTKVYVPYNPEVNVSVTAAASLREAAATLGVELVLEEVSGEDDILAAIETLPEDIGAIFLVPSPNIESRLSSITKLAADRGIAVGSNSPHQVEEGVLVAYGANFFYVGKQAARLVNKVFKGIAPGDQPVEVTEYFLTVNLKTAETLHLDLPDTVLRQVYTLKR